ncbi:ankyrin repeat protein-like protein, partial [Leptotrombidium deliense]
MCEQSINADVNVFHKLIVANEKQSIHSAALSGDKETVINLFADINDKSNCERTALHLAVRNKQYEIIELLVLNGADCCSFNEYCETPFQYAFQEFLLCCGETVRGCVSECKASRLLANCPVLECIYYSLPDKVPKCAHIAVAIFMVTHGNAFVSFTNMQNTFWHLIKLFGDPVTLIINHLAMEDANKFTSVEQRLEKTMQKRNNDSCDMSDFKPNHSCLEKRNPTNEASCDKPEFHDND